MDFLDNSGHIFSLPSYNEEPIGHEFEENDYIFWIDNDITSSLSINNYYSRVINLVIPYNTYNNVNNVENDEEISFNDLVDINITIDSKKYWLLKPIDIQNLLNGSEISDIVHNINLNNLNEDYKYNKLTNDDLFVVNISNDIEDSNKWATSNIVVVPIYVIGLSNEEGTWISNILIHVNNKDEENYPAIEESWCSISVGGIFKEENEIITINAGNQGIELPKDIFRAVYQCSFVNDVFNEDLYNLKVKEYLMNFMSIKGEKGNFRSANNSLKWFGYGEHIQLTKLIKTDNDIKEQYINDWFNIKTDLIKSFRYFTNSTLLSLKLKENNETGQNYPFKLEKNNFYGEGQPILEDLFKKEIPIKVGNNMDQWTYWKPYYDFTLYEMGLKISCLKYFYEKYFLPIYLNVHSASITHKVYANDLKFDNKVYNTIRTEALINIEETYEDKQLKNNTVEFESNNSRYFTHQIHYIDKNFNEFNEIDEEKTLYKIDDTCLTIPIKFNNDVINGKSVPTYFNCVLLLEREGLDDKYTNNYVLSINNYPLNVWYYDIKLYDKETRKELDLSKYEIYFNEPNSIKKSDLIKDGIDGLKKYLKSYFNINIFSKYYNDSENYSIEFCYNDNNEYIKLDLNKIITIIESKFNNYSYQDIVELKNIIKEKIGNNNDYVNIYNEPIEYIDKNWYIYIPSINNFNFNPMNNQDIYGQIYIIPKINIKIKFDKTEIHNLLIKSNNGNSISLKDNVKINYIYHSKLIYESHFNFVQNENDEKTIYNAFILYPKYINNENINYFVNKKFTLRLLVNNHWYVYEFETKMPDVNLKFGVLKYKYYSTTDNYYSKFSQLKDLTDKSLVFNTFMYQPDFVNVNHINFYEDLDNYIKLNSIKFLNSDNELLKLNNFNRYIDYEYYDETNNIKHIKIYISKYIIKNKIYIYLDNDWLNEFESFRLIPGEHNTFKLLGKIQYDDNEDFKVIGKNSIYFDIEKMFGLNNYQNNKNYNYIYFKIDNNICYSSKIILDKTNLVKENGIETVGNESDWIDIAYDLKNNYHIERLNNYNDATEINHIKENIYLSNIDDEGFSYQQIKYNIIPKVNSLYNKYTEKININNQNYLNNILVYNIYKNTNINKNIFNNGIFGNISLSVNGIVFSHYGSDEKIQLSGRTLWSENVDSKYIDLYGFYINNRLSNINNIDSKIKINNEKAINHLGKETNIEASLMPISLSVYKDEDGEIRNNEIEEEKKYEDIGQIILNNIDDFTKNISKKTPQDFISINNNIKQILYYPGETNEINDKIVIKYKTGEVEENKFILNVKYIKINPDKTYNILQNITNYDLYRINNNTDGILDIKILCTIKKVVINYKSLYNLKKVDIYNNYDEEDLVKSFFKNLESIKDYFIELGIINKKLRFKYYIKYIGVFNNYMVGKLYQRFIIYKTLTNYKCILMSPQLLKYISEFITEYNDFINIYYKNKEINNNSGEIEDLYDYFKNIYLILSQENTNNVKTMVLTNSDNYYDNRKHDNEIHKQEIPNKYNIEQPGVFVYNFENFKYNNETGDQIDNDIMYENICQNMSLTLYKDEDGVQISSLNGEYFIKINNPEKDNAYQISKYIKTLTEQKNINTNIDEKLIGIIHTRENNENNNKKTILYNSNTIDIREIKSTTHNFFNFENKNSMLLNKIIYSKNSNYYNNLIQFNILPDELNFGDSDIDYECYVIYKNLSKEYINDQSNIFEIYVDDDEYYTEEIIKSMVEEKNINETSFYFYTYKKYTVSDFIKNYTYTLDWETTVSGLSINLLIIYNTGDPSNYESKIISKKGDNFIITNNVESIHMFFVVNNNEYNHEINGYVIPKIYSNVVDHHVEMLKYTPSSEESKIMEFDLDGKKYIYDDNSEQKTIDLYNDFFEIDYLSTKDNEENTGTVYEIEKIFNIEKQYNNWILNNKFECKEVNNINDVNINCLLVTNGEKYYEYSALNGKNIYNEFNFINDNVAKTNIINFIKYDMSIKTFIDFYDLHVYTYNILNNEFKEEKTPDYLIDENYVKIIKQKISLNKFFDYDFYLMHDFDYWYAVFISKETINKSINYKNLIVDENYKTIYPLDTDNEYYSNKTEYTLKFIGSNNEFLINRMDFEENDGINHFDNNKMIVAKIENNNKLPVDILDSSKWEVTPKSLGMNKNIKITSNQEMALLSFGNNNVYERGYYNVNVRYSLDRNIQHQLNKTGIIRIN